jgi:hypothetical protein
MQTKQKYLGRTDLNEPRNHEPRLNSLKSTTEDTEHSEILLGSPKFSLGVLDG